MPVRHKSATFAVPEATVSFVALTKDKDLEAQTREQEDKASAPCKPAAAGKL